MGNPDMDGRLSAPQANATVTKLYSSKAWIEGLAEDQLNQVSSWAGVSNIAAFPDLHPGKYGPVGCAVLADRIYPQLIGSDIGCGMSLFQLDLPVRKLKLEKAVRRIRVLGDPVDQPQEGRLEQIGLPVDLFAGALGTIGGGNHFCEIQTLVEPQEGCDLDHTLAYLLVHSGSRGLGDATLNALKQGAFNGLTPNSAEAAEYVHQHDKAVQWAALNRQIIAERAAIALRADVRLITDVPHNILAHTADGWLHRKGAALAAPLVRVAGSRATSSYLVQPLGLEAAMASLADGAGRRYDRSSMHGGVQGKRSDITAIERTPFGGRVICEDRDLMIEEAPHAYKSAASVVSDLEEMGVAKRIATLNPLLTFKKTRKEGAR